MRYSNTPEAKKLLSKIQEVVKQVWGGQEMTLTRYDEVVTARVGDCVLSFAYINYPTLMVNLHVEGQTQVVSMMFEDSRVRSIVEFLHNYLDEVERP